MNNPSVVIVGASNLVSIQRQPLVACDCSTSECTARDQHITGIPPHVSFKIIAQPGAKFEHKNPEKDAYNMFRTTLPRDNCFVYGCTDETP